MNIIDDIDAAIGCQHCKGPLGDSPSGDFCTPKCQTRWHAARSEPLVDYQEPTDLAAHVHNQREIQSPETTPGGVAGLLQTHLQVDVSDWLVSVVHAMNAFRARLPRPAQHPAADHPPAGGSLHPARLHGDEVLVVTSPGRVVLGFDPARNGPVTLAVACEHGHVHLVRGVGEAVQAMQGMRGAIERAGQALGQLFPHVQAAAEHRQEEVTAMRRALELRRTRNTGPAQASRAPRRIDPRRTR